MCAVRASVHPDELVVDWLTANVGTVVHIEQQPRWRPVWFADVEREGEVLELCVRGDRHDFPGIFPLEHEMLCQRLLHEHGIPVPAVPGWIDEPRAFVTDRIAGRPHFEDGDDRDAVVDDYLGILARLHALDVAPFEASGVRRNGMQAYIDHYRPTKQRPEPFLEFCLGWLDRHPLDHVGRESMVVWDSGQF